MRHLRRLSDGRWYLWCCPAYVAACTGLYHATAARAWRTLLCRLGIVEVSVATALRASAPVPTEQIDGVTYPRRGRHLLLADADVAALKGLGALAVALGYRTDIAPLPDDADPPVALDGRVPTVGRTTKSSCPRCGHRSLVAWTPHAPDHGGGACYFPPCACRLSWTIHDGHFMGRTYTREGSFQASSIVPLSCPSSRSHSNRTPGRAVSGDLGSAREGAHYVLRPTASGAPARSGVRPASDRPIGGRADRDQGRTGARRGVSNAASTLWPSWRDDEEPRRSDLPSLVRRREARSKTLREKMTAEVRVAAVQDARWLSQQGHANPPFGDGIKTAGWWKHAARTPLVSICQRKVVRITWEPIRVRGRNLWRPVHDLAPCRAVWVPVDIDEAGGLDKVNDFDVVGRVRGVAARDPELSGRVVVVRSGPTGLHVWVELREARIDPMGWYRDPAVRAWLAGFGYRLLRAARHAGVTGGRVDPAVWSAGRWMRMPGWRLLEDGETLFRARLVGMDLRVVRGRKPRVPALGAVSAMTGRPPAMVAGGMNNMGGT